MPDQKPKRRIKKTETVRERAEKSSDPQASKGRILRDSAAKAGAPLRVLVRFGRTEFHPVKLPDTGLGKFLTKKRTLTPRFLSEAFGELKQVSWPNRKETTKLTTAVLIFAIVFGSVIAAVDYLLDKIFRSFLLN